MVERLYANDTLQRRQRQQLRLSARRRVCWRALRKQKQKVEKAEELLSLGSKAKRKRTASLQRCKGLDSGLHEPFRGPKHVVKWLASTICFHFFPREEVVVPAIVRLEALSVHAPTTGRGMQLGGWMAGLLKSFQKDQKSIQMAQDSTSHLRGVESWP